MIIHAWFSGTVFSALRAFSHYLSLSGDSFEFAVFAVEGDQIPAIGCLTTYRLATNGRIFNHVSLGHLCVSDRPKSTLCRSSCIRFRNPSVSIYSILSLSPPHCCFQIRDVGNNDGTCSS